MQEAWRYSGDMICVRIEKFFKFLFKAFVLSVVHFYIFTRSVHLYSARVSTGKLRNLEVNKII